jgi:hypothetical protein
MKAKTKILEIQVTANDIKRGEQDDSESCPIALAIKRATHCSEVEVSTHPADITFTKGGDFWGAMPGYRKEAALFARRFDRDKELVKPRKFRIKFKITPKALELP